MSEQLELKNALLSRRAAQESMVLLKNRDKALPISQKTTGKVVLCGKGAVRTVRGGTGSGDPFNGGLSGGGASDVDQSPRFHIHVLDAFKAAGFEVPNEGNLRDYAARFDTAKASQRDLVMSTFFFPEERIEEENARAWSKETDTAIYVISRSAGEGNDRELTGKAVVDGKEIVVGDYELDDVELHNLKTLRNCFGKLIVLLNVGGVIDMTAVEDADPDAVLLMGQAGQEGGPAVVNVLTGAENPSGRLTDTWACAYRDYPTSATFAMNDGDADTELYEEGIYVGYRYFDTFDIPVKYCFGYGLSYTSFAYEFIDMDRQDDRIIVKAKVRNTGDMDGREVLQLYVSHPDTVMEEPRRELISFTKTPVIKTGEEVEAELIIRIRDLANFDEKTCSYLIPGGDHVLYLGDSLDASSPVARLSVQDTITVRRVDPLLPPDHELHLMHSDKAWQKADASLPSLTLTSQDIACDDATSRYKRGRFTTYTQDPDYKPLKDGESVETFPKKTWTYAQLISGECSLPEFMAQLTDLELATLCCGSGWGVSGEDHPIVGENSKTVPGAAGETATILADRLGLPSIVMADGPGGIRVKQEFEAENLTDGSKQLIMHHTTAWPVGTLLAQSFDEELLYEVGTGFTEEMEEIGLDIVLGPGMNIHRDPMCGRNFEYFSEDPLLSGYMAAAITRGIQKSGKAGACIKHYMGNNQETHRSGSNSVMDMRTMREIYLKGFEIAVRESDPVSIMTSYNKVNGVPASDSVDLCDNIARAEWGFTGFIMTDWNGGESTPWISMTAGNDMIMPGGSIKVRNIMMAASTIDPEFDDRGQVACERLLPFAPILDAHWNSFTPDSNGQDTVTAPLGEGHTASVENDRILVDGEPVYTNATPASVFFAAGFEGGQSIAPMTDPADTSVCAISEDGRALIWKGTIARERTLSRGEIMQCASRIVGCMQRLGKKSL